MANALKTPVGSLPVVRAVRVRIWDQQDATTVLGPHGTVLRFDNASAAVCRAVLEHLGVPRTRDQILAHLDALAGPSPSTATVLDALLATLHDAGVIHPSAPPPREPSPSVRAPRVVLGLTGAVASAHAPELVGALQHRGMSVRVAATRRALRFVAADALAALTHHPVAVGLWGGAGEPAVHVALAAWADLVLVAPASATTVSRLAHGSFTDAVCATAGLARGNGLPVVVAPSMNPGMHRAPAVVRAVALLRDDGFHLVHPTRGLEVADSPAQRQPVWGPCPAPEDLSAIVHAVLGASRPPYPPRRAADWEALYAGHDPTRLPWSTETPDPTLTETLDALGLAPGARALDVGTGTGEAARALAARGCHVVATDVSRTALRIARDRPGGDRVTWMLDDVLHTDLQGAFDLVHDRGCLHALAREDHPAYVRAVTAWCAPGGVLLVTAHGQGVADSLGTTGFTREDLARLFQGAFTVASVTDTPFRGPAGSSRPGMFAVLRRATRSATP